MVSVLLFAGTIYCSLSLKQHDNWRLFVGGVYSFTLIILLAIDTLLKVWLKLKTPALWFVEAVGILGVLPFFQVLIT